VKKPSLNAAAIKRFLLHHGEKPVVAVLGLLAALLVWWGIDALRSQSVDRNHTPQFVDELAGKATIHIGTAKQVPTDRLPPLKPLSPRLDPWRPQQVKIAAAPAAPAVFDRPLRAELTKRTQPAVFPIADLQAVAGIAVLPDPRGANRDAAAMATRPADTAPAPEEPRGGRPPRRRPKPRDQAGEGLFSGGELSGPMAVDLPPDEPLMPGRVTPFIVVTGLIPTARQQAEFESRFRSVSFRDPRRDAPRWGVYIVERTRIVPGAKPRWERMKLVNIAQAGVDGGRPGGLGMPDGRPEEAGPALAQETLPGGFMLQPAESEVSYTAALPARIDEPWGSVAVHPWFRPQLEKFLAGAAPTPDANGEKAGETTLADVRGKPLGFVGKKVRLTGVSLNSSPERQRDVRLVKFEVRSADGSETVGIETIGLTDKLVFATSQEWATRLAFDAIGDKPQACNLLARVDMIGKTPVARILEMELLDDTGAAVKFLSDPNPAPVEVSADIRFGDGGPAMAEGPGLSGPLAESRLFRFVDTSVEQGAEYRYRVRFALRNPNVGLAPQHVTEPAITRGDFLFSDYSNETPAVRVPDATRILVRTMSKDAARKLKIKGDAVELLVLAESQDNGNFALRSTVTATGGLANVDPTLNRPGSIRFFGEEVTTDRMLLDVRGQQEERGDTRSSVPPEPLEMLFLRPDGGFEFVAAADSEPLVGKYRSSLFKPGEDTPEDGRPESRDRDVPPRGLP
jgi:hypothetical protein